MDAALRVLMTATSYPVSSGDWRARFIHDLAAGLAARDDLRIDLWAPPGPLPAAVGDARRGADAARLARLSERGGIAHLLRRAPWQGLPAGMELLWRLGRAYRSRRFDIVHANWLQTALPLMGTSRPALITVLGTDFALLRFPGMVALLRRMLAGRAAMLAPNAGWMVPKLREHFGDLAEIREIPFGVEQRWFEVERTPAEPHRWLAVTRLTRGKVGDLFTWGAGVFGPRRALHLFGPMQEPMELPSWVTWHGPTNPETLAREWFPTATGLISLSRHDEGRPQIMLDAMAATLPVLVSDLPAHRDLVRHRETGWVAASPDALEEGLARLEVAAFNRDTGLRARQWVRSTVGDWSASAARYARAYRDILEARPA